MCIPLPRRHRAQTSASPFKNLPYQRLSSPPPTPRMAPRHTSAPVPAVVAVAPPPSPSAPRTASQYERLLMELLPFGDTATFRDWLDGPFVRGSWDEFCADYLSLALLRAGSPGAVPEPDKARTARAAREALDTRKPKFLVYHPDKTGWAVEDHYVRFIVTLIADNGLRNMWYDPEWKRNGLDITKAAHEVLVLLKAAMVYPDPNPPSYSA
ncbi:hypothetical protein CGRA01v4_08642 [Colletotrichum graminicola]|uniref:Uncharacterized protein n=1 Tax=Colletotrichum graminicola (strain M1.001 / M2 / FGSC 10212) TaxID=645133 RepID=E3QJA0_COLGM|nr:uncharacterized protein GLRG_06082 [Colletotrichum graminicola M1.001]EFQ30938.1 hypothetical protein GLRG_06082 [Colletotrichum graminicola M1.001]WDK17359.1 hypothetical protein CGRA01v4_08642 [Colletotrichum graminicola]